MGHAGHKPVASSTIGGKTQQQYSSWCHGTLTAAARFNVWSQLIVLTVQCVRGQAPAGAPAGLNLRVCFCISASPPMLPGVVAAEQLTNKEIDDGKDYTLQLLAAAPKSGRKVDNTGSRALHEAWYFLQAAKQLRKLTS
jgi:hypothetical protein